jgi:predicted permease
MTMVDDLKATCRLWARRPVLPLLSVVALALATGAAMTSFSVLDAIALKPLPVDRPRELVGVSVNDPEGQPHGITPALVDELARTQTVFTRLCGFGGTGPMLVTVDGALARASVEYASPSYFEVLGAHAAIGRLFETADQGPTPAATRRVAVISTPFWRTRFNNDPNVVGRTLKVGDGAFTIVGVVALPFAGMQLETPTDVVVPQLAIVDVAAGATPLYSDVIGRLRPGVPLTAAEAALKAIWPTLVADTAPPAKDARSGRTVRIPNVRSVSTGFSFLRNRYEHSMTLLTVLGAWMLLTACLSIAGLLVVRVVTRLPELRVRTALGASRGDVVRGVFVETTLLSVAGAIVGAAGAARLAPALAYMLLPVDGWSDITAMNWRIVATSVAVTLAISVLLGAGPAWLVAQQAAAIGPRHERGVVGTGTRWGRALLVAQFAVSLVLLVGAGLFVGTFEHLDRVDLGFNPAGMLVATAEPVAGGYRGLDDVSYYHRLADDLTTIPGVQGVSMLSYSLFRAPPAWASTGAAAAQQGTRIDVVSDAVGPDFFRTMGVPVLRGRDFGWSDTPEMPPVAVLPLSVARRLFPAGDAVGRDIWLGKTADSPFRVIGVVADAAVFDARNPHPSAVFVSREQRRELEWPFFLVRTRGAPAEAAIRSHIAGLGHEQVISMTRADAARDTALARERLAALLAGFFGALAMLLAVIAAFGQLAQAVARRTRELGLRMALGARPRDLVRLVVWQSLKVVVVGIAMGVPAAFIATQFIAADVYGMPPRDPMVFVAATLTFVLLALAAAYIPARRAASVDPNVALRHE